MTIQLRGGHTANDPRLGCIREHDPANARFSVAALELPPPALRTWPLAPRLDQGDTPRCVGFGWTHRLDAEPRRRYRGAPTADWIYHRAQHLDEWAGEGYEGTSVLAGAKACRERGWVTSYRWAFTLDDVLRALSHEGPVVMATKWLTGMFAPNAGNFIHPTGQNEGGHCWMLRAINPAYRRVLMTNSWGAGWGRNGEAWLTWEDLEVLLLDDGQACVPTEV